VDEQGGEPKEEEVIDEGIGEFETEELVSESGWRRDNGSWFKGQGEA